MGAKRETERRETEFTTQRERGLESEFSTTDTERERERGGGHEIRVYHMP